MFFILSEQSHFSDFMNAGFVQGDVLPSQTPWVCPDSVATALLAMTWRPTFVKTAWSESIPRLRYPEKGKREVEEHAHVNMEMYLVQSRKSSAVMNPHRWSPYPLDRIGTKSERSYLTKLPVPGCSSRGLSSWSAISEILNQHYLVLYPNLLRAFVHHFNGCGTFVPFMASRITKIVCLVQYCEVMRWYSQSTRCRTFSHNVTGQQPFLTYTHRLALLKVKARICA